MDNASLPSHLKGLSEGSVVTFTFPVGGIWRAHAKGTFVKFRERVSVLIDEVEDSTFEDEVGKIKHLSPQYVTKG